MLCWRQHSTRLILSGFHNVLTIIGAAGSVVKREAATVKNQCIQAFVLRLIATVLAVMAGCSEEGTNSPIGPPPPGNGGGADTNVQYIMTPVGVPFSFVPTGGATNLHGAMVTAEVRGLSILGVAVFLDSAQRSTSAGTVSVNDNALQELGHTDSLYYFSATLPGVTFDGSFHRWRVSGSASIPAIYDSVQSAGGPVTIAFPRDTSHVSIASDLTVSWSSGGNDSVFVILGDESGTLLAVRTTGDNYSFPAARLQRLRPGRGFIELNRYRLATAEVGDSPYVMVSMAFDEVGFELVP
jgi:hypothetical protein